MILYEKTDSQFKQRAWEKFRRHHYSPDVFNPTARVFLATEVFGDALENQNRGIAMQKKSAVLVTSSVQQQNPEPLLVPLSEAARLLGVKVYSIRRLTRKGVLKYKVIGNRWLISTASLKAFAADGRAA